MRNLFSKSALTAIIAMAGLTGSGQIAQAKLAPEQSKAQEIKATVKSKARKQTQVRTVGGLDLVSEGGAYGLSPKEYGQRFGTKSKGGKTNRLRLSHSAKVKRRKA